MARDAWADAEDGPMGPWGGSWQKLRNLGAQNVKFDPSVMTHEVVANSTIYGAHPRTLDFSHDGHKIQRGTAESEIGFLSEHEYQRASFACP